MGARIAALVVLLPAAVAGAALAQWEFEHTIETTLGDTTETFWLQIPAGYDPGTPCPLLIGWHQWGSNHWELRNATRFDDIANERGWIAACHLGVSTTHWNNHPTQSHVVDVIDWIAERYTIDERRIYMVGSSMGGAAGMIFANNHLDPSGPMVAAAASVSGIQDCERRFYEQGINNSMIAAFGGTPDEVPYEYHRNSAIYFADSTESMHFNARHLPLMLTFGNGQTDQIWREHAEDLYAVLSGWADTVYIRESELGGHGWGCAEQELISDFLEGFVLDPRPHTLSINADEEGWWFWVELAMRLPHESFARFEAEADVGGADVDFCMLRNVARAALDLPALGFPYDRGAFHCHWSVLDGAPAELAFLGVPEPPVTILRDGVPFASWWYEPSTQRLTLIGDDEARYAVIFDAARAPEGEGDTDARADDGDGACLALRADLSGQVRCHLPVKAELAWVLFDMEGRAIARMEQTSHPAGEYQWRLPAVNSGPYVLRLELRGPLAGRRDHKLLIIR